MRFFLIIAIMLANLSYAEEIGYVTDSFKVTLRAGPGIEYKIIALLSSGEPVKIISQNGNWTKVIVLSQKHKNMEGWMLTSFIMKRKPYKSIIESLREENISLKEEVLQLKNQLDEMKKSNEELDQKLEEISQKYEDVKNRYETLKKDSSDFLSLRKRFEETKRELKKIRQKTEKLSKENEFLKKTHAHKYLLTGAFILFSGIILGLILGRRKRRSIYYS